MPALISIDEFIAQSPSAHLLDVRSESEHMRGHFPGAFNIPILNDEHRKEVGTLYKQKGRQEAVIRGFELAGPKFGAFIKEVKKRSVQYPTGPLLLYCWRGGMRSAIAEWILTLAGFQTLRLKGGYKSFRQWALNTLIKEKNILVLGGKTGSGKTELLQHLRTQGERVIDLEYLACHKGSAFGGLGQLPQPTNEHFENMLALEWTKIPDHGQQAFAWLENESRTIGKNQLPNPVYDQIRKARTLEIVVEDSIRLKRILAEYACFSAEQLIERTSTLKKRLGGQHLKESLEYLDAGNMQAWAKKMLDYYDKAYAYGMEQREKEKVYKIELKGEDFAGFAKIAKEYSRKLFL